MRKGLFYGCITAVALAVGGSGTALGYRFITQENKPEIMESATPLPLPSPSPVPSASMSETIQPDTRIVYEYQYNDGKVERVQEKPPYFLLDMTEDSLAAMFQDWELVGFSSEQVTLRKEEDTKNAPQYIVGIQDGYIAVFYHSNISGSSLKEITDTNVSTLSVEEKQRLNAGIKVYNDDNLVKVLEDYGS